MNVGDRVRLRSKPSCQDVLGFHEGEVGIIKDIDATLDKTCFLISFADGDVYTSALGDEDFEVLRPDPRTRRDAR